MTDHVVLLPLDGSELAEGALPLARAVARALGFGIRLVSVVDTGPAWPHARATAEHDRLLEAEQEKAKHYLHQQAARLETSGQPAGVLLAQGEPIEQLLAAAEDADVALVVIATHGRGGLQRWYLGSVADKLMRLAPRPVLLLTPEPSADRTAAAPLRRIAVPLDGSELAEAALPVAARLAQATGAALLLIRAQPFVLTATEPYAYVPDLAEIQAEIDQADQAYLQEVRTRLQSIPEVETVLLRGAAPLALLDYFKTEPADLVVMTTHSRGGVKRLVLGSTADRIVRSGVPTLLLRPDLQPGAAISFETAGAERPA
ncbi:MAG TPA: universal stress protein [Dehalococcoidia bacterium]|nr:universal stress protein [Dehalococcoidia bacterium]